MKHFLDILAGIRIVATEVGGTVTLVLLVWYGLVKAWQEFVGKLK